MNTIDKSRIIKRRVVRYFNSQNEEIIFIKGNGPFVFDNQKRKYIDCVLGYGPVILGHSNSIFNNKVSESLNTGIHLPSFTPYHENYISNILNESKIDIDVVSVFMKTSSEAVTGAIRISTLKTGKKGVLRCGFSGWHDVQHANSPSWHLPPQHRKAIRNTEGLRGVSNDEKVLNWASLEIEELKSILNLHGDKIACFIIDAFQWSFVDKDVMEKAIAYCREFDIVIVIDETKTAGRVSPLGHIGNEVNLWDILILGKAIGNGAPLSLLLAKEDYYDYTLNSQIGGTHSKELLSVQCALITQEIMQTSNAYAELKKIGNSIAKSFNSVTEKLNCTELLSMHSIFGGSLLDIRFKDQIYNDPSKLFLLQRLFLDNGLLFLVGHPSFVSLSHNQLKINDLEDIFYKSILSWLNEIN